MEAKAPAKNSFSIALRIEPSAMVQNFEREYVATFQKLKTISETKLHPSHQELQSTLMDALAFETYLDDKANLPFFPDREKFLEYLILLKLQVGDTFSTALPPIPPKKPTVAQLHAFVEWTEDQLYAITNPGKSRTSLPLAPSIGLATPNATPFKPDVSAITPDNSPFASSLPQTPQAGHANSHSQLPPITPSSLQTVRIHKHSLEEKLCDAFQSLVDAEPKSRAQEADIMLEPTDKGEPRSVQASLESNLQTQGAATRYLQKLAVFRTWIKNYPFFHEFTFSASFDEALGGTPSKEGYSSPYTLQKNLLHYLPIADKSIQTLFWNTYGNKGEPLEEYPEMVQQEPPTSPFKPPDDTEALLHHLRVKHRSGDNLRTIFFGNHKNVGGILALFKRIFVELPILLLTFGIQKRSDFFADLMHFFFVPETLVTQLEESRKNKKWSWLIRILNVVIWGFIGYLLGLTLGSSLLSATQNMFNTIGLGTPANHFIQGLGASAPLVEMTLFAIVSVCCNVLPALLSFETESNRIMPLGASSASAQAESYAKQAALQGPTPIHVSASNLGSPHMPTATTPNPSAGGTRRKIIY